MANALDWLVGPSLPLRMPEWAGPLPLSNFGDTGALPLGGAARGDSGVLALGGGATIRDSGVLPVKFNTPASLKREREEAAQKAERGAAGRQAQGVGRAAEGQRGNAAAARAQGQGTVPAEVPAEYRATLEAAAAQYGVDPTLLAAQLKQENNFQARGTSPAGAQGIAQFIPSTAAAYGVNVNDPHSSIQGMAHYMSDLLRRYGGNQQEALAAYNGGDGAVQALRAGRPYGETRTYLERVNANQAAYRAQSAAPAPAAAPAVVPGGSVFPVVGYRGPISTHGGNRGGMDIMAPEGTPIVAMRGGVVTGAGNYPTSGGNYVEIRGNDGNLYYYAHMQAAPLVAPGQPVEAGTPLGMVGRTGNARNTPPHLHLGIGPQIFEGVDRRGGTGGDFDAQTLLRAAYEAALAAYANGAP